jgi:tetratricopeptide (TPR) repeat protein
LSEAEGNTEVEGAEQLTKREGPGERKPTAEQLPLGKALGRYLVLELVGEGGMGVVYAAYDPELDRKVAIKLLQIANDGSSGGEQAWLLREAQALARLQHPNVVAVYDVGSLQGDQVFVAMELVDGTTMREWLKVEARTWRDVLPLIRAAGAGLAAAHHAGLVHRDFKPENVLVGRDGRVRVMDFGLARIQRGEDAPASRDSAPTLGSSDTTSSSNMTFAGHVVGTPAYLAPECQTGEPADPRADQFAFGVSLFEALYGARPYSRKELVAAAKATPPKPKLPADARVPVHLQRIALRAISIDPAARYPSMDELLAELAIDPTARRRRAFAAVGVMAAAGALVAGTFALRPTHTAPCVGTGQRLTKVWDPATKQAVRDAFLATKKPFAADAFAGLERALDAYTGEWTAAVTGSCEATRVRGEQSEAVQTVRQACYDQQLDELRALTALIATGAGGVVAKGDKIVGELQPVAACSRVEALLEPGVPAPEQREQARALMAQIAEAKAALIAGQYLPSMITSQKIIDAAKRLNFQPVLAEALMVRGTALLVAQNIPDAEEMFAEATYAAIRGKRDDIAADAGMVAAATIAEQGGRPDLAKIWLDHASAAASRVGYERAIERRRLEVAGLVEVDRGNFNAGVEDHEKALAAAKADTTLDQIYVVNDELLLATTLSKAGAYGKAVPHYERSLELREASVGKHHPDIATLCSDLGAAYTHDGAYAKAHAVFARALEIREAAFGKNSPMLIATLDNFGELLRHEGDFAGALASQERAMAMARVVPGTANAMFHQLATDYTDTLVPAGRLADAHKVFDEVLPLEEQNHSSVLPATQAGRAELALAEKAWQEAIRFADLSIAGYEAVGGKDNAALWRPLTALGRARLGTGQIPLARELLTRALAIGEKAQISAADLAPTRDALAAAQAGDKPQK